MLVQLSSPLAAPECQALVVRAPGDLVPLLLASARGEGWPPSVPWPHVASVCVNIASGGYPGTYPTGLPIRGIDAAEARTGVHVFHAGTARRDGTLVTAGARVLGVTAVAETLEAAIDAAYGGGVPRYLRPRHHRAGV